VTYNGAPLFGLQAEVTKKFMKYLEDFDREQINRNARIYQRMDYYKNN